MSSWLADNLGWVASLAGAGGGGAVGSRVFSRYLDHRRDTRKQTDEVAMGLVELLEKRVEKLETSIEEERAKCDAELRMQRHKISNQRTMIYSLLHLFEVPAARRRAMLDSVRADLQAMERAEAVEKGISLIVPPQPVAATP